MKTRIVFCMSMMFVAADMVGSDKRSSFERWNFALGNRYSNTNHSRVLGRDPVSIMKELLDAEDLMRAIPKTSDNIFEFMVFDKLGDEARSAFNVDDHCQGGTVYVASAGAQIDTYYLMAQAYLARTQNSNMRTAFEKLFVYVDAAKTWKKHCCKSVTS